MQSRSFELKISNPVLTNLTTKFYPIKEASNSHNIKLLKEHYEEGKHQGQGTGVLVVVFLVLQVFFAAFLFLLYVVTWWVMGWV